MDVGEYRKLKKRITSILYTKNVANFFNIDDVTNEICEDILTKGRRSLKHMVSDVIRRKWGRPNGTASHASRKALEGSIASGSKDDLSRYSQFDTIKRVEDRILLKKLLSSLSDEDALIIFFHVRGKTLIEMADYYGVTEMCMSQRVNAILKNMSRLGSRDAFVNYLFKLDEDLDLI